MGSFKISMIFVYIATYDVFQSLSTGNNIDMVYILVALICSFVGSSVQVSHKNLERGISKKEVWAIYVTSVMVAIMGYFIGDYTKRILWVALFSVFVSYMSLDLFKAAKKAVLGIVGFLPKAFWMYVKFKYPTNRPDEYQPPYEDEEDLKKKIRKLITVKPYLQII